MTASQSKSFLALLCLLITDAAHAAAVKLVNTRGNVIEAELLKLEGSKLSFGMAGKTYHITLDQLAKPSQDLVRQTFASAPKVEPAVVNTPAASGNWEAFFPNGLVDAKGNSVSAETLQGKMVLLYFGASWCGICNVVVPPLKSLREMAGKHLEVVLVGRDNSESDHFKYMQNKDMPWPSIPWSDAMAKEDNESRLLSGKYQAWGLPTVVLLSPTGELLDEDARSKIQWLPEAAIKYIKDYDYREAVKSYRESIKKDGGKVDAEKEEAHIAFLRADNEKRLAMYQNLLDKSKSTEALPDAPTWEQLLIAFYKQERKRH